MSIGADAASAAGRRGRLRELLAQHDLDGLLVTDLANIRYLSGFSGSNAALFVSAIDSDDDVIATDARYTIQVSAEAPDLPARVAEAGGALRLAAPCHMRRAPPRRARARRHAHPL